MTQSINPEKMVRAVGAGGDISFSRTGAWIVVTGAECGGETALVNSAKQQKCDAWVVKTPVSGLYVVGLSSQVAEV